MERERQGDQGQIISIVMIVLLASGVLLRQLPFEGSRPAATEAKSEHPRDIQSVEARLWQDPFQAVERKLGGAAKEETADIVLLHRDALDRLHLGIKNELPDTEGTAEKLVVVGVMVPGAPYSEAAEQRRRLRYAVLSGLDRAGFVPADEEHIGYVPFPEHHCSGEPAPKVVPFEFLAPDLVRPAAPGDAEHRRLLVLWIDEDAFGEKPLKRLADLVGAVLPDRYRDVSRVRIIGPASSSTLAAMLRELQEDSGAARSFGQLRMRPEIYSPLATAAGHMLGVEAAISEGELRGILRDEQDSLVQSLFDREGVDFLRVSGSDLAQAAALLRELERRAVDPSASSGGPPWRKVKPCIALVSEWDTFYGRALPRTLQRLAAETDRKCIMRHGSPGPATDSDPRSVTLGEPERFNRVLRFSYMRGLDGQAAPGDTKGKAGTENATERGKNPAAYEQAERRIERADGNSQFDYLRRLADRIEREDRSDCPIGAIGVLGSDLYDKLLILQALRHRFSDKIFFTTDLDARFLHPRELEWTRNLLVASTFGLELHRDLQHDIPPFRDSYQTAAFLATMLALDGSATFKGKRLRVLTEQGNACRGEGWFAPAIFEVGRTRLFQFGRNPEGGAPTGEPRGETCRERQIASCTAIHPPATPMYSAPSPVLQGAALVAILLGGLAMVLVVLRPPRRSGDLRVTLAACALLAASVIGWQQLAAALTEGSSGDPMVLAEGISIWPTQAARLLALALAALLLILAIRQLRENCAQVSARFCDTLKEPVLPWRRARSWRQRLGSGQRLFLRDLTWSARAKMVSAANGPPTLTIRRYWWIYCRRSGGWPVVARVGLATFLWMVFGTILFQVWPAFTPARGHLSYAANFGLIMVLVVTFIVLTFFIFDQTRLCRQFIERLSMSCVTWPKQRLDKFCEEYGVTADGGTHVREYVKIQLVQTHTEAVGRLIPYPFIVLALMILARSTVFDSWNFPVSLAIVLTGSGLVAVVAARHLRGAAEAARQMSLDALARELLASRGSGKDTVSRQIEFMIAEIKAFRHGAFAPILSQPWIKSLLYPLGGGLGGSALLDYLLALNL